jgi:hypothetical protein
MGGGMKTWLIERARGVRRPSSVVTRAGFIAGVVLSTAAMVPGGNAAVAANAPLGLREHTASPTASPAPSTATSAIAAPSSERYTLSLNHKAKIPAFARKYSLPCSACHTVWPELNNFGQVFKDNGYQLMNNRDTPIAQSNSYFPIAFRTTPNYHIETTTNQLVDGTGFCPAASPTCTTQTITQQGFDLTGVDVLMLGTLYKNITFGLVPTLDPGAGTIGVESAFIRFDNIGDTPWFNFKFGKFELDNMLSEKRITTLSNNGGFYSSYHFNPVGDVNAFGLGDNQLGMELMGHDSNSYLRYTAAVLSTSDGTPGLPTGKGVDFMFTLQKAFQTGLNLEKIGLFGVFGQYPTGGPTSAGAPIAGAATGNVSFTRAGVVGSFFINDAHLELIPIYMYGQDNVALTPAYGAVVPTQNPTWNAFLIEAHYIVNPQLLFEGRYETVQMSKQADPNTADIPKTQGNIDVFTLGMRLYVFMFSRDGLALHVEYSSSKTIGAYPLSGDGAPPIAPATAGGIMVPLEQPNTSLTPITSSSFMLGLDFAF